MEVLQAPPIGLADHLRIEHNQSELARVYPESGDHVYRLRKLAPHDIIIKIGGEMVADDELLNGLVMMQDHGLNPVLVHGGGPQIKAAIEASGFPPVEMDNGVRPTPPEHMPSVSRALSEINQSLCAEIEKRGGAAEGIENVFSGIPAEAGNIVISNVSKVETSRIIGAGQAGKIAVVSCVGKVVKAPGDPTIEPANVNADTAVSALAKELGAEKTIFVMTPSGVHDNNGERIPELKPWEAWDLIKAGVIKGGMVEKVNRAADLVMHGERGLHDVVLTQYPLSELFTDDGSGTIIHRY